MLQGTRNKTNKCKDKFKLSVDDTEVKEVSTFKFLGITVDQNLTLKNHVDDLTKKCSRSIGILYKVKQFLPESALLSLFYTIHCSLHILTMVLLHGVVPTVLIKTDFMSYKSVL